MSEVRAFWRMERARNAYLASGTFADWERLQGAIADWIDACERNPPAPETDHD